MQPSLSCRYCTAACAKTGPRMRGLPKTTSQSVALGVLALTHHLAECHTPHVEEGPGDGEQGQGQHGNDADIEALVILVRSSCCPSRSWHGGSCQRCAHDCGLLLLLQGRFSSLWGCHEGRRRSGATQDIGGRSDEQQRGRHRAGTSHDLLVPGRLRQCCVFCEKLQPNKRSVCLRERSSSHATICSLLLFAL